MPKRKRSAEDDLGPKLAELRQELARALKTAKGFERQRLSKRFHAEQAQDKKHRLEREIAVLKVRAENLFRVRFVLTSDSRSTSSRRRRRTSPRPWPASRPSPNTPRSPTRSRTARPGPR